MPPTQQPIITPQSLLNVLYNTIQRYIVNLAYTEKITKSEAINIFCLKLLQIINDLSATVVKDEPMTKKYLIALKDDFIITITKTNLLTEEKLQNIKKNLDEAINND